MGIFAVLPRVRFRRCCNRGIFLLILSFSRAAAVGNLIPMTVEDSRRLRVLELRCLASDSLDKILVLLYRLASAMLMPYSELAVREKFRLSLSLSLSLSLMFCNSLAY